MIVPASTARMTTTSSTSISVKPVPRRRRIVMLRSVGMEKVIEASVRRKRPRPREDARNQDNSITNTVKFSTNIGGELSPPMAKRIAVQPIPLGGMYVDQTTRIP